MHTRFENKASMISRKINEVPKERAILTLLGFSYLTSVALYLALIHVVMRWSRPPVNANYKLVEEIRELMVTKGT